MQTLKRLVRFHSVTLPLSGGDPSQRPRRRSSLSMDFASMSVDDEKEISSRSRSSTWLVYSCLMCNCDAFIVESVSVKPRAVIAMCMKVAWIGFWPLGRLLIGS